MLAVKKFRRGWPATAARSSRVICSPRCRARKTDGARFVKDAVARGAVAVLGAPALAATSRGAGRALHRR